MDRWMYRHQHRHQAAADRVKHKIVFFFILTQGKTVERAFVLMKGQHHFSR